MASAFARFWNQCARPFETSARNRSLRMVGAVLLGISLSGTSLGAQISELKRLPNVGGEPRLCEAISLHPGLGGERPARADSLVAAATRAAILGNNAAASALFQEAAELDPSDPIIAYRLARALDEEGDEAAAVTEYCRFMALRPDSPEGAELRRRVAELRGTPLDLVDESWHSDFQDGLAAYSEARFDLAAEAFSRVISVRPETPEALFNRAAALADAGRDEEAVRDFTGYLTLLPQAQDREEVLARMAALTRTEPFLAAEAPLRVPEPIGDPSRVLVQGLFVPGLAQHATGRTGLALAVLTGAGAAVYYGTRQETVVRTVGAYDPFGNFYEYETSSMERANQTAGFAAAVGISLVAAVEGYLFAQRRAPDSPSGFAGGRGPQTALTLPRLTLEAAPDRFELGIAILRLPF
jgi:tetratricopeptide (TPR) repeat protein